MIGRFFEIKNTTILKIFFYPDVINWVKILKIYKLRLCFHLLWLQSQLSGFF